MKYKGEMDSYKAFFNFLKNIPHLQKVNFLN